MIRWLGLTLCVLSLIVAAGCGGPVSGGAMSFDTWTALSGDEGLSGWRISTRSAHGGTQAWMLEDGAITGTQDKPGNGGILLSEKDFGDFILELELNPDWGLDSGLFLRGTEDGRCYQVMVDYYEGGNIGGVYGEGIGGFKADPPEWKDHYRDGEWNKLLVLVLGNPPTIDVWLNGHHITSWKGEERLLEDTGRIALQVHAGDRYFGKKTRFRNIRIREFE